MRHVADHNLAGFTTEGARPDFNPYKYLRGRGLINEEDYSHLYSYRPEPLDEQDTIVSSSVANRSARPRNLE